MAMKTAKKYNPDLILHGNLIRAILSLAIPVVINSFLQTMYNLTDTYWLGKIGTEQLAAINLVTPMQNIITNFGSGITVAGAVLIAQYIGAGEKEDARSMANQIFAFTVPSGSPSFSAISRYLKPETCMENGTLYSRGSELTIRCISFRSYALSVFSNAVSRGRFRW